MTEYEWTFKFSVLVKGKKARFLLQVIEQEKQCLSATLMAKMTDEG